MILSICVCLVFSCSIIMFYARLVTIILQQLVPPKLLSDIQLLFRFNYINKRQTKQQLPFTFWRLQNNLFKNWEV